MNVLLDSPAAALVREKVDGGHYPDASAVVREALRLLDERDRMEALRAELQIGLDQAERGEVVEFTDELMDQLVREAEENARLGKPIKDAVKP